MHIVRLAKRATGRTLRPRLAGGLVDVDVDVAAAVVAIVAAMRHFGHELVGIASVSCWATFTLLLLPNLPLIRMLGTGQFLSNPLVTPLHVIFNQISNDVCILIKICNFIYLFSPKTWKALKLRTDSWEFETMGTLLNIEITFRLESSASGMG